MSVETFDRPKPASHSEQMDWRQVNYERQISELKQLAGKRFWELYFDKNLRWWGVRDSWGRIVFHPRPEAEIRGFFANQPFQA